MQCRALFWPLQHETDPHKQEDAQRSRCRLTQKKAFQAAAKGRSKKKIRARAYCSSANLGPGFDVFGIALDAFYDEVAITVGGGKETDRNAGTGKITISYTSDSNAGLGNAPPTDPNANTAGLVVKYMLKRHGITDNVHIAIKKGVPTGLGLGSSAASAAAAAVACDRLFGKKANSADMAELVMAAGRGEEASAGTIHYDNVAASVAGGFVMVRPDDPVVVAGFTPAKDLRFCIAMPAIKTPDKKTKVSRGVLPKKITLKDSIRNLANASLLAASLATKDSSLLGCGLTSDVIVEPARKHMIPGFDAIRSGAISAGAKEVMISGAGPSVIAIMSGASKKTQQGVAAAMSAGFDTAKTGCTTIICKPARGARIVGART